jgi:lysophospholipase L1-like esterase
MNAFQRFSSGAALLVIAAELSGCSSRSPIEPTTASVSATSSFSLSCPADIEVRQVTRGAVHVEFALPRVEGAAIEPVSTACQPSSGAAFLTGSTVVHCEARDGESQTAACAFHVRVRPPRRLSKTRFLAFGDSVTEGYVSTGANTLAALPVPYPPLLEILLEEQFTGQDITVINAGRGRERTDEGLRRLLQTLPSVSPEAVLLLEGYNNIREDGFERTAADLKHMAEYALQSNVDVFVATLTPVSPSKERLDRGTTTGHVLLNGRILVFATELEIGPPVDLWQAFGTDRLLLGADGWHPSPLGYRRIADTFLEAIVKRYEVDNTFGR